MKEQFREFDKDGDGTITTKELGVMMQSAGWDPTDADLQETINTADTGGDGTLNFLEFLALMETKFADNFEKEQIREAFQRFDKDGSGYITAAELREAMTHVGQRLSVSAFDEMIGAADTNEDGKIQYEEFVEQMKGLGF